jgi:hypothetical protein
MKAFGVLPGVIFGQKPMFLDCLCVPSAGSRVYPGKGRLVKPRKLLYNMRTAAEAFNRILFNQCCHLMTLDILLSYSSLGTACIGETIWYIASKSLSNNVTLACQ